MCPRGEDKERKTNTVGKYRTRGGNDEKEEKTKIAEQDKYSEEKTRKKAVQEKTQR